MDAMVGPDPQRPSHSILTVRRPYNLGPPAGRAASLAHEAAHTIDPYHPENASFYQGEDGRLAVQAYIGRVVWQCGYTNIGLNSYHKQLMAATRRGKRAVLDFERETFAILCQLALTDRGRLEQVDMKQRGAIRATAFFEARAASIEAIPLITPAQESAPQGIDAILLNGILRNIHSVAELRQHSENLKQVAPNYATLHYGSIIWAHYVQQAKTAAKRVWAAISGKKSQ
jgi:hypothetical protein